MCEFGSPYIRNKQKKIFASKSRKKPTTCIIVVTHFLGDFEAKNFFFLIFNVRRTKLTQRVNNDIKR